MEGLDNTSTALGPKSEPQPDVQLRILPECGGRTVTDRRFVRGVPELIVEIAHTTRSTDLGPKLDDYERAGVREYVVRALEPDEVLWHVLEHGRLVSKPPDEDGLYRSRVFPGLWLDPGRSWPTTPAVSAMCSISAWRHRTTRPSSNSSPRREEYPERGVA